MPAVNSDNLTGLHIKARHSEINAHNLNTAWKVCGGFPRLDDQKDHAGLSANCVGASGSANTPQVTFQ